MIEPLQVILSQPFLLQTYLPCRASISTTLQGPEYMVFPKLIKQDINLVWLVQKYADDGSLRVYGQFEVEIPDEQIAQSALQWPSNSRSTVS